MACQYPMEKSDDQFLEELGTSFKGMNIRQINETFERWAQTEIRRLEEKKAYVSMSTPPPGGAL